MKIIKKDEGCKREINTETYLKKKNKKKKENIEKLDILICLKKRKKRLKEYQKNYREVKNSQYIIIKYKWLFNYDMIINKIVF